MTRTLRTPSYRLHRPTGQAVVTLNGRDYYLGRFGTDESKARYGDLTGTWLINGRRDLSATTVAATAPGGITVVEVADAYWSHIQNYYRKPDGSITSEVAAIRAAIKPLRETYGRCLAAEFGPLKLDTLRTLMIEKRWARTSINKHVGRIVRMFKWAASKELVAGGTFHGLKTLVGLRKGRSGAKETERIKPVSDHDIEAVLAHASATVGAMIRLQRLTGMRSGELCILRRSDIDESGDVWIYTPTTHKTAHHGHSRKIAIGTQGQKILQPMLTPNLTAFIFTPPAVTTRSERRRRVLGGRYTVASYRRAIARSCDDAFLLPAELQPLADALAAWCKEFWSKHHRYPTLEELPDALRASRAKVEAFRSPNRWHPHQLRHNAASDIERKYGLETARAVLGHRSPDVTALYAERDQSRATEVMRAIG